MFIHLPLIHFAPLPRLLIDFKNSNWLTYFCILLCINVSLTWLAYFLSCDYLSYINFCFSLTKGPMLETLDYTIRIGSTPTILYFDLILEACLTTLTTTYSTAKTIAVSVLKSILRNGYRLCEFTSSWRRENAGVVYTERRRCWDY